MRPSSPNAITLHTIDALRHRCRWPPVIPSEVASPELWKTLLREVRVQIGYKGAQPLFVGPHEPRNHAVLSDTLSTRCRLCIRFGHSPPLQGPLYVRNDLMRIDILPREAQRQEATGDKPAVAPAIEAELVLVAVVGVAVELHDHPTLDHQIHLANALDLHSVLEAQARSIKVHSRQRLQGGTSPVTGTIEPSERPSRARAAQQVPNLIGSDPLIVKCRVERDEWRVVLDVAAQETSQHLRERLNRVRGWRYTSPVPVCMEHLPPGSRESPAGRNHKMNLLGPLGHGKPVVAHSGLASDEPSMNARQNNGALSTRDTDNPMLIGDELTIPHERGDVTALGASRLQVPHAHRSVAATNNGEQVCAQGAHGAHCRPPAEWAQPGRRRPVDNWRIRRPVASRTHRSVTDALTQNCHPCPETQHPIAKAWCPNRIQRSPTTFHPATRTAESRGFVRRAQYSLPPLYPIWTLPTTPGPSAGLEPHGRPFAGITVTHAHPDPDGTPHLTPPPRPPRGSALFCRAGPTSTDQVAGSCGRSRSDSLVP